MKFLVALAAIAAVAKANVSYDGYKVFNIDTHQDYDAVLYALGELDYVSMSCQDDHDSLDVAIGPEELGLFNALGLDTTLIVEDLGAEIAEEGGQQAFPPRRDMGSKSIMAALPDISYFNSYRAYNDHVQFLRDLQASFPSNSRTFSVGNSVEGRAIPGIQLWGSSGPNRKPAIIWHGTVHAREWITAPTVEYMAYKLVQGYQNNDALIRRTLDNYDIHILPVVNPDGFVYTSSNDRFWRKNRQRRSTSSCIGTDINRNWPYQWVGSGSSTNACAETYRGQVAGDTPENRALTNHTDSLAASTGIKFYVDWHSFSQLILLPYGYSCSARATNHAKQMSLAGGVASAIRGVNGLSFRYGPSCSTIYQTNGGSSDYVADVNDAEFSWAFELRPASSSGNQGFVVPASQIIPSGEENWAGMRYMFNNM